MSSHISVALCTHNGARFIETQLRSILSQSRMPDEIVISDDASTDGTIGVVRELIAQRNSPSPSIVILENEVALGVAANFERAIQASHGDLIVLSDQDDSWHPDRISRSLQQFDSRAELDLLFSDARIVDAAGEPFGPSLFATLEMSASDLKAVHDGRAFELLLKRNLATGATVMFRRRLLGAAIPFATGWIHDEWLTMIAATTGCLDVIEEPLIDYRQHGANVIGVVAPTLRRKIQRVLQPRGGRNARLARQFAELQDRIGVIPDAVSEERRTQIREKARFEFEREKLPTQRLKRIPVVISLQRRGWYAAYASQGTLDIVRDLLQPHTP